MPDVLQQNSASQESTRHNYPSWKRAHIQLDVVLCLEHVCWNIPRHEQHRTKIKVALDPETSHRIPHHSTAICRFVRLESSQYPNINRNLPKKRKTHSPPGFGGVSVSITRQSWALKCLQFGGNKSKVSSSCALVCAIAFATRLRAPFFLLSVPCGWYSCCCRDRAQCCG